MATENYERIKGKTEHHSDVSLWFALLFLLGFGLVMIYSASSYTAFSDYGDQMYYLKRQAVAVGLGLIAMLVVSRIPYHFWERFSVLGVLASAVLICLVKTPLGVESHGARRWIKTGIPGFNLQPAEVTKLAIILFLAVLICKMGSAIRTWKGLGIMIAPPFLLFLMIWKITNNMSSALIVMAIAAIMVFVASPDYKKFVLLAIFAIAAAIGLVLLIKYTDILGSFRAGRIRVWLDPESDPDDKGFQTLQALYAIGSGGIRGKGLGQSMQKLSFLPESQNDMIFSIICEELGLLGAASIMLMFTILIWRMMIIANNATDLFGGMLVSGVIAHIAVQAILNVAVVTNTIPNTGISLPFISYGGSSVIFLLIEMGLVFSVARGIEYRGN
ncbi:MAG: cell division protein FtsW [Lachnospiraceae bacterium]|jgi:cell division protein FtsW|nr:cell division protein FtsW [Lachnospiraceae bacterium]MBR3509362.1 cell division protein FtsW [Lachnospiraceae bacterium]MBR4604814.1 cell division protein FtsW [Lachnospiraceae bacterium]MBR6152718.1 cell division protein FtsW [Lachnospiraceae bacterium]